MKKFIITLFVTCFLFLLFLFLKTGRASQEFVCTVRLSNIPNGTAFVELFVEEELISNNYTKCNEIAVKENGIAPESEIVTTKFDNFISYTYHHKNSSSLSNINNCEIVYNEAFDDEFVHVVFWNGFPKKYIEKCDVLMVVYVDEDGQILGKSDIVHINKLMEKSYLIIDGEEVTVKYNNVKSSVKLLMFLLIVLIEAVLFIVFRKP